MKENNNYKKSISIRADENMERMIGELKEILPLNTSSIIRLSLMTFHRNQMKNNNIND